MKILFLISLFLGLSITALCKPLLCSSSSDKYSLKVSDDQQQAELFYEGEKAPHGDLTCRIASDIDKGKDALVCKSHDVVDAGYSAYFVETDTAISVRISETSVTGTKELVTLPCQYTESLTPSRL